MEYNTKDYIIMDRTVLYKIQNESEFHEIHRNIEKITNGTKSQFIVNIYRNGIDGRTIVFQRR